MAVSGCLGTPDPLAEKERKWLNSHTGRIVIGGEPGWPPVSFYDDKGRFYGMAADYVRLLEKKLGCRFIVERMENWPDVLEKAESSKIDIVMNIVPTRDRAEFLRFTQPYMEIPTVVITRKDVDKTLTLSMMDGMEVAVTEEYQVCDYLQKANPNIRLVHVDNSVKAVKRLSEGEFDAFVSEVASTSYIIEKEGITNLHIAGFTGHEYNLTIGCVKDRPILAGILEKGLSMISLEERERIKKKWISLGREDNEN